VTRRKQFLWLHGLVFPQLFNDPHLQFSLELWRDNIHSFVDVNQTTAYPIRFALTCER